MGNRVLLTGGSGFVGACLARHLLNSGHEVHLLLRRQHRQWRLREIWSHVRSHMIDAVSQTNIESLVRTVKPDWIFHLAAYGAYSTQNSINDCLHTNVLFTTLLAEAAIKVGCKAFINAGSSSEYGLKVAPPLEVDVALPNSYYACTKLAGTNLVRHLAVHHDANLITLRLYSVYGPYEEPSRLIPQLIVSGLAGQFPPMASPKTARDFVYVSDVCDAFEVAATRIGVVRGSIYNIGTGEQTTLAALAENVGALFEIPGKPDWGRFENRSWDTQNWCSNPAKAKQELGWAAKTKLIDGLNRTIEWVRQAPQVWQKTD